MSSPAGLRPRPLAPAFSLPALGASSRLAIALGVALAALTLTAKGGLSLGPLTNVGIALTLTGAGLAAAAVLSTPTPRRLWGGLTLFFLGALAAWSALSVIWSIQPAESWIEANRLLAYVAAFGGAMALARLVPERGGAVLAAVVIAAVIVCASAVATKAFPGALDSREELGRLREPLGYWNALGLLAAMAAPACLWAGARRDARPLARAAAFPLLALLLLTIVLSFSRGAFAALIVGVAFWMVVVPLRLRGAAMLASVALIAGGVAVWAARSDPLSGDRQPLAERITAGHDLALLIGVMLLLAFVAGLALERLRERRPASPRARHRAGVAALVAVALMPIGGGVALAFSDRGFTGSISHGVKEFFSTKAKVPKGYGPDRLTSTGSKRGAYWDEANKVFKRHRLEGAGAGAYGVARLRHRRDTFNVRHAHGYLPQTAADLGIVGLVISLGGLLAWTVAARRATRRDLFVRRRRPVRDRLAGLRRWRPRAGWAAERVRAVSASVRTGESPREAAGPLEGHRLTLLTLAAVVVTFGAHSMIDWTWFVPGTAVIALVAAGYVAGSGPPAALGAPRSAPVGARLGTALMLLALALVGCWAIWQPQRSDAAADAAVASLSAQRIPDARVQARNAVARNPLAVEPLFELAAVEDRAGRKRVARRVLEDAVRLQPANPATWRALAEFSLNSLKDPSRAYGALRAAVFLDPKNPELQAAFVEAYRQLPRKPAATVPPASGEDQADEPKKKKAKKGKKGKGKKSRTNKKGQPKKKPDQ